MRRVVEVRRVPLVAGSTRTGTFSVTLDQTAIPLLDPKAGNVRGQLEIVQATVSPGPLAQPLLWSAGPYKRHRDQLLNVFAIAAGRQLTIPPQVVQFQLANQRVYHKQFHVVVGNVTLRTRGSVGWINRCPWWQRSRSIRSGLPAIAC